MYRHYFRSLFSRLNLDFFSPAHSSTRTWHHSEVLSDTRAQGKQVKITSAIGQHGYNKGWIWGPIPGCNILIIGDRRSLFAAIGFNKIWRSSEVMAHGTLSKHVITIKTAINSTPGCYNSLYIDIKQNVPCRFQMAKMYSITGGCTWLQLGWLRRWWSQVSGESRESVVWSGGLSWQREQPPGPRVCVCVCVCVCVHQCHSGVWHDGSAVGDTCRHAHTERDTFRQKGDWQVSLFGRPACLHFSFWRRTGGERKPHCNQLHQNFNLPRCIRMFPLTKVGLCTYKCSSFTQLHLWNTK